MKHDDFYIGWMPNAPKSMALHTRRVVWILFPLVLIAGLLFAGLQKKFSRARFEFGVLTEVQGLYRDLPVPHLRVKSASDLFGKASYVTIPLVGYGKHGAGGVMRQLGAEKDQSLDNRLIRVKGTLLYNDGKTIMQIDKNDNPLVAVDDRKDLADYVPVEKELGLMTMRGEIVDPKCYFGVMKPGRGKPHKDCAIRCILGGIPPVMRVSDANGRVNYYLVVGPRGEPMNETVRDFVAEPVALHADVKQYDDWIILYVQDPHPERISYLDMTGKEVASCSHVCAPE